MPEGDAVLRTARRLSKLDGQTLSHAELRWPSLGAVDLTGTTVIGTRSVGKHLLTRLDTGSAATRLGEPGLTLHSHLRMDGAWRVNPAAGRGIPSAYGKARAVLATDTWIAVGYQLGMLDLLPTSQEHTLIGHLGPDVLGPGWDVDAVLATLAETPDRQIGEALLDQTVLAGVGTYFASEALFLQGISPYTEVAEVPRLRRLIASLPALLAGPAAIHAARTRGRGSAGGERQTVGGRGDGRAPAWVYGRRRHGCRRCGGPLAMAVVGAAPRERELFWCRRCQLGPAA